jgi:hypothetical protein
MTKIKLTNETRKLSAAERVAADRAKLTNDKFVAHLMNYSRHGVLMQAFILEAMRKYAEACKAADPMIFDSALLNGKAWQGCAVELCEAFEARHKR